MKISCGIDEVGRGPWAGNVMAACVILPENHGIIGLNDSKKLSAKKRETLFEQIKKVAKIGIGEANVQEIDEINILQASMLAMQRAYINMNTPCDIAYIDGNKIPNISCPAEAIIGGDGKVESISAASIIAKVTRDKYMQELAQINPEYSWQTNAGYGTKAHIEAIKQHGITQHHRKSFAPIKKFLYSES